MATFCKLYGIVYILITFVASSPAFNVVWKSTDNSIYVIDGVFGKQSKVLNHTINALGASVYKFTVDGVYDDNRNTPPIRMGFATKSEKESNKLKAPIVLQKLISRLLRSQELFVNAVQGRIIERGDFNPVITHCFQNSSKFLALLILSKKWQRNNYGEIVIYDRKGDILRSIHPKYGRIVILECGIHFKVAPPCINMEERHYFLLTEFGPKPKHEVEHATVESLDLSTFLGNSLKKEESHSITIIPEKFVTKRIYSSKQKGIFIYDNAIPAKYVDILHDYIHNHADYVESPVFDEGGSDNVKWIISLDDPAFINGPIWNVIKQLLIHAAGREYFPYDLACNHVRRTDNTHMHKDNYYDADEYTVLIYLNKNWTENDYGETSFFENNEIIGALRPRYGRVAIFHGTIDHSAHPASPVHHGARYTFAIKTAASVQLAMSRMIQEEFDMSYDELLNKVKFLEANGTQEEKDLASATLEALYSGNMVSGEIFGKLKLHLVKNNLAGHSVK